MAMSTKKNFEDLSKALRENIYKRKQKMRALAESKGAQDPGQRIDLQELTPEKPTQLPEGVLVYKDVWEP